MCNRSQTFCFHSLLLKSVEHWTLSLVAAALKVPEDIAGGQKREEEGEDEGEDPYNEENIDQVGSSVGNHSASLWPLL